MRAILGVVLVAIGMLMGCGGGTAEDGHEEGGRERRLRSTPVLLTPGA